MSELVEQHNEVQVVAPDQFIQKAIEGGSDITVLNGLFELKQKYEASEAKKAFIRAMQEFQQNKPNLAKADKVKFKTSKGTTEYNFCSLPAIEKALREPLYRCELNYRFENLSRDKDFGIRCVVTHVQGHSEMTEMYAPRDDSGNKNVIQGIGSTSSYLMRYTLIAAFALTTADADDDGVSSGDLPYLKLIEHNEALRDNLLAVQAIKDYLAGDELHEAVEVLYSLDKHVTTALWVAPSKGGIFSTTEIAKMKSDEWGKARREHFAEG